MAPLVIGSLLAGRSWPLRGLPFKSHGGGQQALSAHCGPAERCVLIDIGCCRVEGCRDEGLGFRVLGFRVEGFRIEGFGFRDRSLFRGSRVQVVVSYSEYNQNGLN